MRASLLSGLIVAAGVAGAGSSAAVREVSLNRLDITCVSAGWGIPRWDRSVEGNALKIAGVEYARGLGTHAVSRLVVSLDGKGEEFRAKVGVDDEMAGSPATVEFVVHGDGKALWRSGVMRPGDEAKPVRVGLEGVRELVLEAGSAGDGIGSDHADWVEPVIATAGSDPVAVWREGEEAVESLKFLRRVQRARAGMSGEEVFDRVRRIERLYARLPADDGLVRPLLESLRATGDLPVGFREAPENPPGRGTGRREVWLDEFGASGFTSGWGTPKANRSVEGNPLRIGGREFERGIGTHAESALVVNLHGGAERFLAFVGVDDEQTSPRASVAFVVRGDGKPLWESGVLRAADAAKPVRVDLRGVERLELAVTDAGDGIHNDHADWADARLVVSGRAPEVAMPEPARVHGEARPDRPLDRIALSWENHAEMNRPPERMRKAAAADRFPGKVGNRARRVRRTVEVDLGRPFWHSTGLYAPPGEPVTVRAPREAIDKGLRVRVGCHTDTLHHLESLLRPPWISASYPIDKEETVVANPYGGLIYVAVPARFEGTVIHEPVYYRVRSFHWVEPIVSGPAPVRLRIAGAVEAPRYVKGETSLRKWRKLRRREAPYGEIVGDLMAMQVPAAALRELDDPGEVAEFWDEVMRHQADLAGWEGELIPMYFTLDRQISAGGGHSGYPVMAYESWAGGLLKIDEVREKGTWGAYHELGHNHQWSPGWTFQGQGEVTCNLFSLYCNMKMSGWKVGVNDVEPAEGWRRVTSRAFHLEALRNVYSRDPGEPGKWKEADLAERLAFHVQLIDAFGWEPLKRVIRSYLDEPDFPGSEAGRGGEYMVRYSKAVGRNLHPFFRGWGIEMPEGVEGKVADLPAWEPGVVKAL